MAFIQKIYDNGLAQYVYYTKATITAAPVPSDTSPNHSGNLATDTHAVVGVTGASFSVSDEGVDLVVNTRSLNFIGSDVVATASNDDITVAVGSGSGSHQASHLSGASDPIDGDKLDIDYIPAAYTRTLSAGLTTLNDELTSHLKGIDDRLATTVTGSGTTGIIPVFNGTSSLINSSAATSAITVSGGVNAGVGLNLTTKGGDGSGTNQPGGNLVISGGASTGTGVDGSVVIPAVGGKATRLSFAQGNTPNGAAVANSISVYAPASVTSYNLVLPGVQGGSGSVLSNNGSGVLSWLTLGGGGDPGAGDIAARRTIVGPVSDNILVVDHVLYVNTSAGAVTLTLPAHGATNKIYEIKDIAGTFGTNACTLVRNGGTGTIEGLASDYLLEAPYQVVRIASDTISAWYLQ